MNIIDEMLAAGVNINDLQEVINFYLNYTKGDVKSVAGKTGHVVLDAQDIQDSTDYTAAIQAAWEI